MPADEDLRTPKPLITRQAVANTHKGTMYVTLCRDCGDVTSQESGYLVTEGTLTQITLFAQRHLSRHLTALAAEFTEMSR